MQKTARASQSDPAARIRAYLAALPADGRRAVKAMRTIIRGTVPAAQDDFAYGIPAFRLDGRPLVYYAAWKTHVSLYPITGAIRRALADHLQGYETSKGTVRFPIAEPLPVALVKRLVRARVAEVRAASRR